MAEIQEVRQRPAEFIEALGKTYADEVGLSKDETKICIKKVDV